MRVLALVALGGCGFSGRTSSVIDAPPDDGLIDMMIDAPKIDGAPGTARKRSITIPEANVFGDLTNFPVWFVITDATGLGAKASASGDDIYFTRPDGTPLEHQRMVWTKATGHLEAWVRMDLTDANGGAFDLRFGDPGPAHLPNAQLTFSQNFTAVWHMDDALGGSTTVADVRGAVMGTAVNGPVSVMGGKLGRAIDFDGNNDEVTFTNPITGNNSMTISAWVSVSQPGSGFSSVMTVGNPSGFQSRWFHTNYSGLAYGFYGDDVMTNVNIHNNQFTMLHWVYNGATKQESVYRNGTQVGTTVTLAGTPDTQGNGGHIGNAPMAWGPGGNTTNPVNGIIDEVRIANVARTLGWVRTEFSNQNDVAAFFMIGAEQPAQ